MSCWRRSAISRARTSACTDVERLRPTVARELALATAKEGEHFLVGGLGRSVEALIEVADDAPIVLDPRAQPRVRHPERIQRRRCIGAETSARRGDSGVDLGGVGRRDREAIDLSPHHLAHHEPIDEFGLGEIGRGHEPEPPRRPHVRRRDRLPADDGDDPIDDLRQRRPARRRQDATTRLATLR